MGLWSQLFQNSSVLRQFLKFWDTRTDGRTDTRTDGQRYFRKLVIRCSALFPIRFVTTSLDSVMHETTFTKSLASIFNVERDPKSAWNNAGAGLKYGLELYLVSFLLPRVNKYWVQSFLGLSCQGHFRIWRSYFQYWNQYARKLFWPYDRWNSGI